MSIVSADWPAARARLAGRGVGGAVSAAGRVYGAEMVKLAAQWRAWWAVLACVVGPFVFAAVVAGASTLPSDTLFGRWVQASGFAVPLVVLEFGGLWAFPVLTSVVAGDMFSAEDRFGTWKTLLTRRVGRGSVFAGKAAAAATYTVVVMVLLAAASVLAGLLVIGDAPLVGLGGQLVEPTKALGLVAVSWGWALAPALGFTAVGLLCSVATRYGPAGVGLPVLLGLGMQLGALAGGPELARQLLLTTGFSAYRGLFAAVPFTGPLVWAAAVSAGYTVAALAGAYLLVRRHPITGG